MKTVLLLIPLALSGCASFQSHHRGHFAIMAPASLPSHMQLVTPKVVGGGCRPRVRPKPSLFNSPLVENAVNDALEQAPGADALAVAEIRIDKGCYVVEGAAVDVQ